MNILSGFLVGLIVLINVTNPAHAELSLQQDRLTLHVHAVPLEEVLENLSQEGAFRVTILDKQVSANMTVTEHFDGLPLEDGLNRLLAKWNYGLTKQQHSGKIQEVFLVSKRMKPKELSPPPSAATPARDSQLRQSWGEDAETLTAFTEESSDEEYFDDHDAEAFDQGDFENDQETFTEEMIPEDLPPEMREAMREELSQMNGR